MTGFGVLRINRMSNNQPKHDRISTLPSALKILQPTDPLMTHKLQVFALHAYLTVVHDEML
jgi:hypothetical protein